MVSVGLGPMRKGAPLLRRGGCGARGLRGVQGRRGPPLEPAGPDHRRHGREKV